MAINTKARTASERLEELTTSPDFVIVQVNALAETINLSLNIKPGCKFYPDGFEAQTETEPPWPFLYIENGSSRPKLVYYKNIKNPAPSATDKEK
jgi:hypothetical protein